MVTIEAGPIRRLASVVMSQADERVAVLYSYEPRATDLHARPWHVVAEPAHLATLAGVENRQYPNLKAAKRAVVDAFNPQTGGEA